MVRRTSEVLALCVFEEPHSLVQPRHLPHFPSTSWSFTSDIWFVHDLVQFWDCIADAGPDEICDVLAVEYDSSAFARVFRHYLVAIADIYHGPLPDTGSASAIFSSRIFGEPY